MRINAIPNDIIFWGIIGLNGTVFIAWNVAVTAYRSTGDASWYIWMRKNFTTGLVNLANGRLHTMLTSCFSHEDLGHIAFNMFTFYFMGRSVLQMLGNVGFLGLYLGGGIACSIVSMGWNYYSKPLEQAAACSSHGASGAIYSVISFLACVAPTTSFLLFGIVPMPAWLFVSGIFVYDSYRTVKQTSGTTDSAGHVGGLLSGIAFYIAKRMRIF